MAGDWIKMRGNLWDDPRIARLVDMTDSSEAAVVGALYWLWATADQHTEDGIMPGLSLRQIDRKTGVQGFAAALCTIGWLVDHPEGVRIVGFVEHNGASAKNRLETAKRVAKHRVGQAIESKTEAGTPQRPAISKSIRDEVLLRDGCACVYCGRKQGHLGPMETKAEGYMHLDHVIPLAQGGANDPSNLVASCRNCNMKKSDKTPEQAGMEWPVINGKRVGNKNLLHEEQKSVRGALAREREEIEIEKKKTGREGTARASRLPADQVPPAVWLEFLQNERPDLNPELTYAKFCDYWSAKPGKAGTKLDWLATWRNWVREEKRQSRPATAEPAWRAEQRKRTLQAVPNLVDRGQTPAEFFDVEAKNVTALALG